MRKPSASQSEHRRPAGRLRIVAGNWRGRLLKVVDAPSLRPTPERIRETLFNWLQEQIHGRRCLDLFAGSGALGLEALSRGAGEVVFVEQSRRVADGLRSNLALLGADTGAVVQADALTYLERPPSQPFDLVYLDPPFAMDRMTELCTLLARPGWLNPDALLYTEQGKGQDTHSLPPGWATRREKTAGAVRYALLTANPQEAIS